MILIFLDMQHLSIEQNSKCLLIYCFNSIIIFILIFLDIKYLSIEQNSKCSLIYCFNSIIIFTRFPSKYMLTCDKKKKKKTAAVYCKM